MKKRLQDILEIITDDLGENCRDIKKIVIDINDKYSSVDVDVTAPEESEFEARKKAIIASSFGEDILAMLGMIELLITTNSKWVVALNSALGQLSNELNANYQLTVVKK